MLKIDRQLVKNFDRGDAKAAAMLFEQLRRPLFAYFYRLSGDRCVAEDLLQETLLTIHSRIETYNHDFEFMPWTWTIARNKFFEFKRSQNRVVRLIPQLEKRAQPTQCFSNATDTEADLRNCLDTLSETTKEAFMLKHLQGMTFNEIADLQQIPLATAKSRVLFALKKIREYFNRGEK
ncbi:MAG: RNA polymerase sigma factor [Candidatus Riflebacteria bacterium]|nr:RNA polymerase sigma factor [Candidatus Riflebacteria bacterium]